MEDSQAEKGSLFESYQAVQQERDHLLGENRRNSEKLNQAEEAIGVLKERTKKLVSEVSKQRDLRSQAENSCKSLESTVDDLSSRLRMIENSTEQQHLESFASQRNYSEEHLSRQLTEANRQASEANHRIQQLEGHVANLSQRLEDKNEYVRRLETNRTDRSSTTQVGDDFNIQRSLRALERDHLLDELRLAMQELSELTAKAGISPRDTQGKDDEAMDYSTLYAEYRSLKARCETLNKTVERQASTIIALETRLSDLKYYAETFVLCEKAWKEEAQKHENLAFLPASNNVYNIL
jgi:archaellum component FlaC